MKVETNNDLGKLIKNLTDWCTVLSTDLKKCKTNDERNKPFIYQKNSMLCSSARVLLMLMSEQGKTELGKAKIKKMEDSQDETPLEGILKTLND
jgi:hypothetical protein